MPRWLVLALRVVIVMVLAGSVFIQAWMVPLFWADLEQAPTWQRVTVVACIVLGILTVQVCAVCVWVLLSLVRSGRVFSERSFRFVDVIIAMVAAAAVLVFTLGVALAPGEGVPPGVVLLIGGFGVLVCGVALVVVVLRALLAQAVATDREATALRSELGEVI